MAWLTAAMNMLPMAIDFASGWQERRLKERQIKHEVKLERIRSSANERGTSIKDEVVLFVVAYPIISPFIPWWGIRENTMESFAYLKTLPDWVIWSWLTIVAAVFGMTELLKKVKR